MMSSPYRLGFTSFMSETNVETVPVRGLIPEWLRGTLVRTGPARFEVGSASYNHWFDGLAMLHRFAFDGNRISYANRFLHSRAHDEAMTRQRRQRARCAHLCSLRQATDNSAAVLKRNRGKNCGGNVWS
jgi:beta,beta-carotene 9',10'-dioxygenase